MPGRPLSFSEILADVRALPEFYDVGDVAPKLRFYHIPDNAIEVTFVPAEPTSEEDKIARLAVTTALKIFGEKSDEYSTKVTDEGIELQFPVPTPYGTPHNQLIGDIINAPDVQYHPVIGPKTE